MARRMEKFTFCQISHVSGPILTKSYILTSAIILWCQKWIITESESVNQNVRMYRNNGPRPCPYKVLPSFVMYLKIQALMVQYAFVCCSVCKKCSICVNSNKDTLVIHFKGEICIRGYQW